MTFKRSQPKATRYTKDEVAAQPGLLPFRDMDIDPLKEMPEERGRLAKTFNLGGKKRKTIFTRASIHYKNDLADSKEQWKEVDLRFVDTRGAFEMHKASYDIVVPKDKIGYRFSLKTGGVVEVELVEIAGKPVGRTPVPRMKDHQLFWDQVAPGLDMKLLLRSDSAEIFKLVNNAGAPTDFTWKVRIEKAGTLGFQTNTMGKDDENGALEIESEVLDKKTETIEGKEVVTFRYRERFTGRVARIVKRVSRQKQWITTPTYPLIIDASASADVAVGNDDGFSYNGGANWIGFLNYWQCGYNNPSVHTDGGVRFQSVGVPQGATITTANIDVSVGTGFASPTFTITGDDVDNAAAFSSSSRPDQLTDTTASASWSPTATGHQTIGVTGIVQEIISRSGWSSNNAMRFAFIGSVYGAVTIYARNAGDTNDAVLSITYTAGGGPATAIQDMIGYGGVVPFAR